MDTSILNNIVEVHSRLWNFKQRGETVEIITPCFTTSDSFVSVFLTQRGDEFVVTDGGWISEKYYNDLIDLEDNHFNRLYEYYLTQYNISTIEAKERLFYYKKTTNWAMIPNLVYEVANFISAIVSSSFIQFESKKEADAIRRFRKHADSFIASFKSKEQVDFGKSIHERYSRVKFNSVIKNNKRLSLVNYITGSTDYNFINSIGKTNMNFEIIEKSGMTDFIDKKIALVNDMASGYKMDKIAPYLEFMSGKSQLEIVLWSDKNRIMKLV